ncbi:MAG: hypothetical protein JSU86_15230 [Phycisphaerales bacterium]|nr:MAG: hypothetical protein JSU86_15230 [Phycisphaerales bacterium]
MYGPVALGVLTGCATVRVTPDLVYFPPPPSSPHVVHLKSFNRLHDVVPVRGNLLDAFRRGIVSPRVGTPAGVAFHRDHLYICDTEFGIVHDWNLDTGGARRIGHTGNVVLVEPVAVAVDAAGTVYVADTGRGEVAAFDAAGRPVRRFRPPDREQYRPVSCTTARGRLYIADIAAHRVDVFSTTDGAYITSFGGIGSEPGRFYFPMGVGTDAEGNIFVSDMMNARVLVFNDSHTPVRSMGRPGNRYGDMGKPRHLAVGPDGVIFITDVEFGHVHLFNKQGQLLMLLGGRENQPGDREDQLGATPMPVGVAIAPKLPDRLASLVPDGFHPTYFLFITNTIGAKRISLFALGSAP